MYRTLSGNARDVEDIKAIGEIVVIDGNNHEVVELNSYYSDEREVHEFTYTLKFVEQIELSEEEIERFQNL